MLAAPCLAARPGEDLPPVAEVAAEVDRRLQAIWDEAFLEPDPEASDGVLLRRLSIDLRGVIPHVGEVRRFAGDDRPRKLERWASWFLDTPEHAAHFATRWEHILLGRRGSTDGLDRDGFRRWLRSHFLRNTPWDRVVRELLTASGTPGRNPAANFFLRYTGNGRQDMAKDVAARVSRVFLGTRIECAQCHDHPYMNVRREQFWGLAAFFARSGHRRIRDRAGGVSETPELYERERGEIRMPPMRKGEEPVEIPPLYFGEPWPPGDAEAARSTRTSAGASRSPRLRRRSSWEHRRERLARWITAPDNTYFARATVNRVWAHLLGKGFFNPVDDFTGEDHVAYPELLDYLADDFVRGGYDLRRLVRIAVSTRAYRQRALVAPPGGIPQGERHDYFSTIPIRPLEAEVLARSVLRATGLEEPQPEANARRVRRWIDRAREVFVRRFGVDETEKRNEFQGTVLQVLFLFNGEFTDGSAPAARPFRPDYERRLEGNLDVVLQGVPPARHVERLFLATLSRRPTDDELTTFRQEVLAARNEEARQRALADVQWALLNCAEFLHQH